MSCVWNQNLKILIVAKTQKKNEYSFHKTVSLQWWPSKALQWVAAFFFRENRPCSHFVSTEVDPVFVIWLFLYTCFRKDKWYYISSSYCLLIWMGRADAKFIKYGELITKSFHLVSQFILWYGTEVVSSNSCQVISLACEVLSDVEIVCGISMNKGNATQVQILC